MRKWAKYRRSLEKAQVGLTDYVVRYKGDEASDSAAERSDRATTNGTRVGSTNASPEQVAAELAKVEKDLANAKDLRQRFAVMYASQPAERERMESGKKN